MTIHMYSPADVLITVAGIVKVGGYVDGTFLEMSKKLQPYQSRRTPDGTTARLYIKDDTYSIKFTLAQTSDSNRALSLLQKADEISQQGMFPVFIKDGMGGSLLFSPDAWIANIPTQTYSNGIEGLTWEITATRCASFIGGNSSSSNTTEDLLKVALSSVPALGDFL